MRTSDMIKSTYIRARDVKEAGAMILTIVDCTLESIGTDEKYVLWFNEHPKGLNLNNTKIRILEASFGEDSDYWRGRRVKLTYDPTVLMAGKVVGGIKLQCSTAAAGAPPAGRPAAAPQAILNPVTGQWELPPQAPARPAAPAPPQAVLNPATGLWELPPQAPPARPRTISERVEADFPVDRSTGEILSAPAGEFSDYGNLPPPRAAPAGAESEFDDDIPF